MIVTVTKKNESVICNGKIYTHGQSFEVDDVIGESLIDRGYVEQTSGKIALESLPYSVLKSMAASKGLAATGKKEELIARIRAASEEGEAEAEADAEEEQEAEEGEASDELPNTGMPE